MNKYIFILIGLCEKAGIIEVSLSHSFDMRNSLFGYFSLWGAFIRLFCFLPNCFYSLQSHAAFAEANIETLLLSYLYRLKPDLSFSGYMMLIPSLILAAISCHWPKSIGTYTFWDLSLSSLPQFLSLNIIDLEVYSYWGEKFDAMHLRYLNDPKQITHSITSQNIGFSYTAQLIIILFSF